MMWLKCFRIEFLFLVTSSIIVGNVVAQRPGIGSCPDPSSMSEFDVKKFEGKWYEVERSFYIFETVGQCVSFNFSITEDGSLDVLFSMKNRITGNMNSYTGKALPQYLYNPSIMDFRLNTRWTNPSTISDYWSNSRIPAAFSRMLPGSGRYYILSTDYTNYAIMWSCSDMGIFHSDLVWVLGRKKDLTSEIRHEIYVMLKDLNIDEGRLVLTKHNDCPE